jgi:hypothetical protein
MSTHPTSLLDPGQDPGLWSNTPRGFQEWISTAHPEALGSDDRRCLARRDVAAGAHACLIA